MAPSMPYNLEEVKSLWWSRILTPFGFHLPLWFYPYQVLCEKVSRKSSHQIQLVHREYDFIHLNLVSFLMQDELSGQAVVYTKFPKQTRPSYETPIIPDVEVISIDCLITVYQKHSYPWDFCWYVLKCDQLTSVWTSAVTMTVRK